MLHFSSVTICLKYRISFIFYFLMKNVVTPIGGLILLLSTTGFGQLLQVDNSIPYDDPNYLVNQILLSTSGVTATNVTFNGSSALPTGSNANMVGYFDGTSNIGMPSGMIMNTGDINDAPGPNNSGSDGIDNFTSGDPDLDQLAAGAMFGTFNAAVLEFDFETSTDSIGFSYVFASEEYNEYVCSSYNDVFGFFLSGPGISGPFANNAINIAKMPNSSTYVGINTVNNGTVGFAGAAGGCGGSGDPGLLNSMYFVDNEALGQQSVQYDGFTTLLTVKAAIMPCETYHIKIAVADAGDGIYDSGVFLKKGSFSGFGGNYNSSNTITVTACGGYVAPDGQVYTTSGQYTAVISNSAGCDSTITINLTITQNSDSNHVADFTINQFFGGDTAGCAPFGIMFEDVTSTIFPQVQRTWDFGDGFTLVSPYAPFHNSPIPPVTHPTPMYPGGTTSGAYNQVYHIYENPGTYEVKLISLDQFYCEDSITHSIVVHDNPTFGTATQTACGSYTWIDGNTYTSSNNTATHTLTNAAGCDSVVTLNLTIIDTLTASVTVAGNTLTAQPAGDSYQWLDCDNNYSPIAGETNQSFTATANGSYAVEVTQNNCTDTSDCELITVVGLQENKKSELRLLPNPTTGIITITGAEGIATVYDIYGRLVISAKTNNLDISQAAMGIYFVRVVDEQGKVYVGKVLKE